MEGDRVRAAGLYHESLLLSRDLGAKERIGAGLAGCARIAWAQGRPEQAARLLGAIERILDAMGMAADSGGRRRLARGSVPIRSVLGEETFAAAFAAGGAQHLDAAIAEALALAEEVAGAVQV